MTADEARTFADWSVAALAAVVKLGWALPSELKEPGDVKKCRAEWAKYPEAAPMPGEKK
jgi:hypothetical protein